MSNIQGTPLSRKSKSAGVFSTAGLILRWARLASSPEDLSAAFLEGEVEAARSPYDKSCLISLFLNSTGQSQVIRLAQTQGMDK